jgi:hypothetical protein
MSYNRNFNSVITSVIGFNFKAEITYVDDDGIERAVPIGAKCMPYLGKERAIVGTTLMSTSFFTNFNEELLKKIRDYQRQNC